MSGNLHSSLTVQSNKDSKNIPINQITALSMCTLYKYLMIWKTPSWLVGRKYYSWHDSIQDGMSLHASVLQIFFFFLKECNKYLIFKRTVKWKFKQVWKGTLNNSTNINKTITSHLKSLITKNTTTYDDWKSKSRIMWGKRNMPKKSQYSRHLVFFVF
jgi:hypothetical protein